MSKELAEFVREFKGARMADIQSETTRALLMIEKKDLTHAQLQRLCAESFAMAGLALMRLKLSRDTISNFSELAKEAPEHLEKVLTTLTEEVFSLVDRSHASRDVFTNFLSAEVIASFNLMRAAKGIPARKNARKRHAETNDMKVEVSAWLDRNMQKFKSMNSAAEAIIRLQPIKFSTARVWVGEWKKQRGAAS